MINAVGTHFYNYTKHIKDLSNVWKDNLLILPWEHGFNCLNN